MTDRITNPWGTRTPFGPGEDWPIRVDQFLEKGVSEGEVDSWVQTAVTEGELDDIRSQLGAAYGELFGQTGASA